MAAERRHEGIDSEDTGSADICNVSMVLATIYLKMAIGDDGVAWHLFEAPHAAWPVPRHAF